MRKSLLTAVVVGIACASALMAQQEFKGNEASRLFPGSNRVLINEQSRVPSFVVMAPGANVSKANALDGLRNTLKMSTADGLVPKREEKDKLGFTHSRYRQMYAGFNVEDGEYILHERNGRVETMNGMWFDQITVNTAPSLTEAAALSKALEFVGATTYKWEVPGENEWLQIITNNANATYYPKGELVVVCENGDYKKKNYRFAYKFDVYASEPMSRQWIFVDAHSGAIVNTKNRIHTIDTPGTGLTMYSGTQNITVDSFNGQYRLRESGRGQGVQTFDLNNGTNTANAVDFISATTAFTTTTNDDHCANDAHWGAEGTYDFYMTEMGRNGIDNNGMLMVSYVHYGNNYNNAFWNGTEMTYGDGSGQPGGFNPLTAIDVCAHEFTHGVTEFSANLVYQDEPGALNESFSDIFGAAIEWYKKPAQGDWLMGEEITVNANSALRSMSNPNQFGDPDCYTGTNWYVGTNDNGGVHTNSGVQNYWYYLLSVGGSGTNDLNDAFSVTGIGYMPAADIAFRNLTVYLTSSSQYADARTYAIQSAQDLFGACTPEVEATTNAWYACGVGGPYNPTVTAAFAANLTSSCSVPATVTFTNNSTNTNTAVWDFGDNSTSTNYNPTHVYNTPGTYNVQLIGSSACGIDTVLQSSFITINTPPAATGTGASSCTPASMTLSATGSGNLSWFAQPTGGTALATGNSYTTPVLNNTTTYYVENQVPQTPGNVGPANTTFGTGGQHNNTSTQYLEFTVLQPCTLGTALVNAGSSGNKTFVLWDNTGNQISTYQVNVPATGVQTITLNIPLNPGSYRIGGTQMNLYRHNGGVNYPYTLSNLLSITGSSAGSGFYYYLYNWQIIPQPCTAPRTPVIATIGVNNVTLDVSSYDTLCTTIPSINLSGGSPAGGTYSGPGIANGVFDPAIAGPGVHIITYTYTDQNNCTGTSSQSVFVDVCSGIDAGSYDNYVSIYPNPSEGAFTIEITSSSNDQRATLELMNALGQIVMSDRVVTTAGLNRYEWNGALLPKGVYFMRVKNGNTITVKKLEIL
jgi:Zn-dependent metalloprotease